MGRYPRKRNGEPGKTSEMPVQNGSSVEPAKELATSVVEPGANGYQWYAVYTKGRHEKKVAAGLEQRQIICYLPLWRTKRRWSDRWKWVEFPLFPSYVFVRIDLQNTREYYGVLQTPGVVKMVRFRREAPEPIPDEQIEAIQRVIDSGLPYDPHPYLTEGRWVEVVRGPLKGIRGIIVRKEKMTRLVLSVDLLMRSVSVVVPVTDVEPLW